ncbi:MAG TPA: peroxiredoxin-like family protein [Candidatus Angelobacter sp.]
MSLQEQLEQLTTKLRALVPAERLTTIERAVEQLKSSGVTAHALKPGDKSPEFELLDGDGMMWRSADLLQRGPVVAVFYRGRWCAYCNTQLAALQQIHEQIAAAEASLVAISPQTQKHTYLTRDMHQLRFPVLSDHENETARRFGLAYRVPQDLQKMYESIMTKLPGYNGDQSWELPLAATYVIRPDGTISHARVDGDWRERPEPEEILSWISG